MFKINKTGNISLKINISGNLSFPIYNLGQTFLKDNFIRFSGHITIRFSGHRHSELLGIVNSKKKERKVFP